MVARYILYRVMDERENGAIYRVMDERENGAIWCDDECDTCPIRFQCYTTKDYHALTVVITKKLYDEWVSPHFEYYPVLRGI